MAADRCPVCPSAARTQAEALLQAGSSYRSVARLTHLNRASLARHHREHMTPATRRLVAVPGSPPEASGRVDPLAEALALFGRAKTKREQLKSAQAIRRASWLALRSMGEPDAELLEQLEANVMQAASLFRAAGDGFEAALVSLEGVRDSIRAQQIAARAAQTIPYSYVVVSRLLNTDGSSSETARSEPIHIEMPAADYWRGVPARLRDAERYRVERDISLELNDPGRTETKVYERTTNTLAWASA